MPASRVEVFKRARQGERPEVSPQRHSFRRSGTLHCRPHHLIFKLGESLSHGRVAKSHVVTNSSRAAWIPDVPLCISAYIYVRGEFFQEATRLQYAIKEGNKLASFQGMHVVPAGYSFKVSANDRSQRFYVTALIKRLEGKQWYLVSSSHSPTSVSLGAPQPVQTLK